MRIYLKDGTVANLYEENGSITVQINGVDRFVLNVSSIYESGYEKHHFQKMINDLLDYEH